MPEEKDMFQSLRLGAGGGLNSSMEKVAQDKNTATIAIGLGGTGLDALRTFKKMVYERVKQDNFDKRDVEQPVYGRIKFLEIDSDGAHVYSPIQKLDLSRGEFFSIGVSNIVAELEDKSALKSKPYLSWLNDRVTMETAKSGAGGIRQIGRYLLSKKAQELYLKLKDMIETSKRGLSGDYNINIYVMAGIGGGTGSGCFIDVCYIINQALDDLGCSGNANLLGFFFLPDVNISNPNFTKGLNEEVVKVNGYAALKELDYLMDIAENDEVFEQQYNDNFTVRQSCPPVQFCHILSTTDISGASLENGYHYIMNVVAEYALNYVVESSVDTEENSGITVKGHISNIKNLVDKMSKKYGANYVYNILGASCATVPYRQIGTYLAIKFFNSIKYIQRIRPSADDVKKFCKSIGLEFNRLDVEIKRETPAFSINADSFDSQTIKNVKSGEINSMLAQHCEKWRTGYANRCKSNITTLGRQLDAYSVTDAPESVIGKAYKELMALVRDSNYGPYFAAYMLKDSQNHTITSELKGIRDEVKKRRDNAQNQLDYRFREEDKALMALKTARIDIKGLKKKAYLHRVELRYRNTVEIETYDDFLKLVDKITSEVEKIETEYFKKLTGIIDRLISTFKSNEEYFNTHGMGNEMYTWSVVEIDKIKDNLDEVVLSFIKRNEKNEPFAPYLVEEFSKVLIEKQYMWFEENETKISELISDYISNEFKDAMTKSMKTYLQEKYKRDGQDLIDCIAQSVIKEGLVENSIPVFYADNTKFNVIDDSAKHIVLSVPNDEADFKAAADVCKKTHNIDMAVRPNVLTDRIFMLEFFSGIPLYCYQMLRQYELSYNSRGGVGLHLYENNEKNWILLPSPFPAGYISDSYTRADQDTVDMIRGMYQDAKNLGIITEKLPENKIIIHIKDEVDYGTLMKENWDAPGASLNSIQEIIDILNSHKEKMLSSDGEIKTMTVATGTVSNNRESAVIDNIVRRPIIRKIIEEQLSALRHLNAQIDHAVNIYEQRDKQHSTVSDFIRALLHMVIKVQRGSYRYNFDKQGDIETYILTQGNERYESIREYQAYLGYMELPEEVRKQIDERSKRAANDVTDEMYTFVQSYEAVFKEKINDYKSVIKSGNLLNPEEIQGFLDAIREGIRQFITNNK